MATVVIENYLKALFHLAQKSTEISVLDLANSIGVTMPTVNSMVKKLKVKGYVNYEKYKPLTLTKAGEKKAAMVVRKHRLTEMYLVEKMGFGWDEVHGVAEQIEHLDSPLFFSKIDEILGYPKFDPHGSPIPNEHGELNDYLELLVMTNLNEGDNFAFRALAKSSIELLQFLDSKQFKLGEHFNVVTKESYSGLMTLHAIEDNRAIVLPKNVTDKILVEKGAPTM